MTMEDNTSAGFVGKNEGLVWTLFIVIIVLVGFVSVVAISGSSSANLSANITAKTASVVNVTSQDVDITIVPEDVLR